VGKELDGNRHGPCKVLRAGDGIRQSPDVGNKGEFSIVEKIDQRAEAGMNPETGPLTRESK